MDLKFNDTQVSMVPLELGTKKLLTQGLLINEASGKL
jgi:hypothetical protein